MSRRVLLGLLAICILASGAVARDIVLDKSAVGPAVSLISDTIRSTTGAGLGLEFRVGKLSASDVTTPEGPFTHLSIPGFQHAGTIGAPALPVMNKLIEVPFGAEVSVTVDKTSPKSYSLTELGIKAPIFPRQPPQPKDGTVVPFAYDKSAYAMKGIYQEEVASLEEVGVMRDTRLVLLKVAPVGYDAVEGKLDVYQNVRVKVNLKKVDLTKTLNIKRTYGSKVFSALRKEVLTPPSLEFKADGDKPATYVIVADRMFENDLKPFVEWKTQKGLKVVVGYTDQIGKTAEQVKTFVHGLYNNPPADQAPPSFLLIVGDNEQIPAFPGKSASHITDLYFACVTPGDNIPDLVFGRFSAQNSAELVPQIEKTLQYEKFQMPDPSFLQNVVLVAGWDSRFTKEWGWPQINYGAKYYYNAEHGMPNTSKYLTSGSGQSSAEIVAKTSAGLALLNYTAHGSQTSWADPSFTKSNIDSLQNNGKYPLVIGNCCLTNSFQVGCCFGEAWLRAKDKGAIGYIGGSNSTYWDEDLWWGVGNYAIAHPNAQGEAPLRENTGKGAYDGVFDGTYATNGGMILAGNLAVQESTSPRKLYYWEVYHLMGDPALMVYNGVPADNTVEHAPAIGLASAALEVKAAAGSTVAVSANGALLGVATVGADGKATVALKGAAAGAAQVVVTAQNRKPYIGQLTLQ